MTTENGTLDTLIENRLNEDNNFQEEISNLSEEEREAKINQRKSELLQEEATELWEKAQKATKSEELANNYKTRAEKAEQELKKLRPSVEAKPGEKTPTKQKEEGDLSSKDLYALIQAKVPEEDVEEVVKASKVLGVSVSEALKDQVVQGVLQQISDFRKSANAANTGKAKTGTKTPTDSEILSNARKGEIPEKGTPEAEQLFWAKRKKNR